MVQVYVQCPRWFLRPRNTDWRYTRFFIPRIVEFDKECQFHLSKSFATVADVNLRYVEGLIRRRLRLSPPSRHGSILDRDEFERSGCNVVFSHDDFPKNAGSFPVIWQNSILDPDMVLAWGKLKEGQLDDEREIKSKGFRAAAAVQVSTVAERDRLRRWFPEIADRFIAIPFFLPDVTTIDRNLLAAKLKVKGLLRCIFVGHEARRKGLARVYDAIKSLPSSLQQRVHLTVISRHSDGTVQAPSLPNLRVAAHLPYLETLQLMRQSDVFVMPSVFESYGLVYLEAMAQGAIPIVPDWEVQREIVDYGKAGCVTNGETSNLAAILEKLLDEHDYRANLALNALQRYERHFAPKVVADCFCALFHRFDLPKASNTRAVESWSV